MHIMKLIRAVGIILLLGSGFFAHALLTSERPLQAKLYLGIIILLMIHLGIAATIARNDKSFKESLSEALAWPLNLLP